MKRQPMRQDKETGEQRRGWGCLSLLLLVLGVISRQPSQLT